MKDINEIVREFIRDKKSKKNINYINIVKEAKSPNLATK